MNLAQLEYFLAASRTLNFTRAAEERFTSRQNLSRAIRDLERELGAKLFAQEGNALALTIEGREAAARAERILREVDGLARAFTPEDEDADTLRVLIGTNIINCAPYDLFTALDGYGGGFHVSELGCKACYEAVLAGGADIAFVGCMEREFPGCGFDVLQRDRLYLLVNADSELAGKDSLDVTDLAGHRLVLLPDYEFQFPTFVESCRARGIGSDAVDVISNAGFMMRKVRQEDAVGIASASFKEDTPWGTKVLPLSDPKMRMNLYALYRREPDQPRAIAEFVSNAAEALAAEPDGNPRR